MPEGFNLSDGEEGNRQGWDYWRRRGRRFLSNAGWLIILAIIVIYALQGIYQVAPAQVGLVKRFGKYVRTAGPGLHYHIPAPIESVQFVDVRSVRKVEIGYRTISPPPNPRYAVNKEEALMLTGDDNIVHLEMAVQYTVKDAQKFGFNLIDPEALVKEAAEAVIRQEVVKRKVEQALTSERAEIALDAQRSLQKVLDSYNAGIEVETIKVQDAKPPQPVVPAFDDVTSAKEDKNRKVNEAEAYRNEVVPKARGKAASILNEADAYKAEQTEKAQGEVARFLKVLKEYKAGSQEVTRKRLYIETLEEVLPGMNKVITTGAAEGDSLLKLLNINELGGEKK